MRQSLEPAREDTAALDGGDSACWLHRVCDDCGALVEDDAATACWRCGSPRGGEQSQ